MAREIILGPQVTGSDTATDGGVIPANTDHHGESPETKKPRKTLGFAGFVSLGSDTQVIPTGLEPVLPP